MTSEKLARAIAEGDRSRALDLVRPVLEDEVDERYQFDYEARWNADNAIRDFRLIEAIPLLRKVASLSYSAPVAVGADAETSRRDLLKILAIKSALANLTLLEDSQALVLSRIHVASPVISSTAIRNLKQLQDWKSTEQIRRLLATREPTREAFLDLSAALDFLVSSPQSQSQDCGILRRLIASYGACFGMETRPPGFAGCEDFVRAANAFEGRFRCQA